jgi:DNA-binding MarR family transcriptional regulator
MADEARQRMAQDDIDGNFQPSLAATRAKSAPLPPSLTVWTGYLLGRAARLCRDYFDALVEPLGIHGRHFSVLAVLGEEKPVSQVEMGERLGIDRNTMTLLLDDLEARGLVTRRRDPRDRRAHLVSLTDAGRDVLVQSTALARRTNEEVFAPLSADERAQLHELLGRLL